MTQSGAPHLPAYGLFAALLSAAGLPIYIHAPKFYVDEFGVSLAALGAVLFGLRLLDIIQDPLFGKFGARLQTWRGQAVALSALILALAMLGLFAVTPVLPPLVWFAVMLALVFSSFSFLTILFYAQGITSAQSLGATGHLRLARWRETGALIGVCAASIAPVVLGSLLSAPFAGFAVGFACLAGSAVWAMRHQWHGPALLASQGFAPILSDRQSRRLLLIALINAAPVAVSSTLFLFFVETRLQAPGKEGILLLLFFLSAAVSAPIWSLLAERLGARRVMLVAMFMAICIFATALSLSEGDWIFFAFICAGAGATLGADLTLLPAIFARRLAVIAPSGTEGFGLWSFVSKFTLAFAAVSLLPMLDAVGFKSGATNNPQAALSLLSWLYAGVPCVLKCIALGLLAKTKLQEEL